MSLYKKYLFALPLTILLLCLASTFAEAQRDTTGTAAKTDSIVKYLTPLEYAFMMHEETRFMLRIPVLGVGAEVELLPYFTLMGQVFFRANYLTNTTGPVLNGELRWYYGSKKQGVRNMSGNYFGLGYERTTILADINSPISQSESSNLYYARWGVQRRFIGKGLIDFGLNTGFVQMPTYSETKNNGFFIQTTGQVGLGIVFNNEKVLNTDKLCPVVKCYEKETFLLKLNTTNLLSIYYSTTTNSNRINIQPAIALEQKLFDSPFSIQVGSKLNYNWQKFQYADNQADEAITSRNYGFIELRATARYYYNLKNRIRKGKSGDGLSANYISGGVHQEFYKYFQDIDANPLNISLSTGIQRTFGRHFFFDVELGGLIESHRPHDFQLFGNVQLGLKF